MHNALHGNIREKKEGLEFIEKIIPYITIIYFDEFKINSKQIQKKSKIRIRNLHISDSNAI